MSKPIILNPQKANKTLTILAGATGLAIILLFLLAFFNQLTWTPHSSGLVISIVDEKIIVTPKTYASYNFNPQSDSFQVQGSFDISNDEEQVISMYIMDEVNFWQWHYHQNGTKYYDSGKVNNAEIDVRIETEGRFYLVFDNLSSERPKEVTVDVIYAFVPTD